MIESISYLDVLKRGLRVMDATAISLCQENSLPIVIFNLSVYGNIKRVVTGEKGRIARYGVVTWIISSMLG